MRKLNEIVFVSAVRSPMGRFGGTLKDMKVYDIAAFPIKEALKRANVSGDELDDAIIGSCRQAGNHVNPARTAAAKGGAGESVPGVTINKACPAGMKAVSLATQLIQVDQANIVLCGGMESMSTIPNSPSVSSRSWRGGCVPWISCTRTPSSWKCPSASPSGCFDWRARMDGSSPKAC